MTPDLRARFESAIAAGRQRMLSYEEPRGGFSWYGRGGPDVRLTSWGLMVLADIERAIPLDRAPLDRAAAALAAAQDRDGSWADPRSPARSRVDVTAWVAWGLREAGITGPARLRAEAYLRAHRNSVSDPRQSALVALALAEGDPGLEAAADRKDDGASWSSGSEGTFSSRGDGAAVETTALACLALTRRPIAGEAARWLVRRRDPLGAWGSTQATVLALKALMELSTPRPPAAPVTVRLRVNGVEIPDAFRPVSAQTWDVVQQVDLPASSGDTRVELESDGDLFASWQATVACHVPWSAAPRPATPLLSVETAWDRTELDLGDTLRAVTSLRWRGADTHMLMVELPVPPGFSPDLDTLQSLVDSRAVDRFDVAGTRVTLYLGRVTRDAQMEFAWSLRPRFPIRAQSGRTGAYEYYCPENSAQEGPRRITVR